MESANSRSRHADFCGDPNARNLWWVHDWTAAVRIALGRGALVRYRCALAVVLTPCWAIIAYSMHSQRYWLLVWAVLTWMGYRNRSPRPTGIGGLAFCLIAFVGFVMEVVRGDGILTLCGIVPGITWFASCAIEGVTTDALFDAIRTSKDRFDELVARGILTGTAMNQE